MSLKILYFGVVAVAGALIELLAMDHVATSLITAGVISVISYGLWSFSDLGSKKFHDNLVPGGAALTGVLAGAITRLTLFASPMNPMAWGAIPASVLISATAIWFRSRASSETCFHCRVRVRTVFQCPRCSEKFCGKSDCWNSRGFRCETCHRREVPLFPLEERWWSVRFGNRISSGNCMRCLAPAANTDIRECGQCHWQMCKRCWDLENGQCTKCRWVPQGLPQGLLVLPLQPGVFPRQSKQRVAGPIHH